MNDRAGHRFAQVTYRATLSDGREAGLEFALDPETATMADAWRRLTAVYGAIDPRTLEVEVRRRGAPRGIRPWPVAANAPQFA